MMHEVHGKVLNFNGCRMFVEQIQYRIGGAVWEKMKFYNTFATGHIQFILLSSNTIQNLYFMHSTTIDILVKMNLFFKFQAFTFIREQLLNQTNVQVITANIIRQNFWAFFFSTFLCGISTRLPSFSTMIILHIPNIYEHVTVHKLPFI